MAVLECDAQVQQDGSTWRTVGRATGARAPRPTEEPIAATGLPLVRRQLRKLRRERIGTAPSGHFRSDWRPPRCRERSTAALDEVGRPIRVTTRNSPRDGITEHEGLASHGKSIEPMVVEFRHTSLSAGSLKLFPATRTAIARTRSSLEHEHELGHGLALAPAHELGVVRRCD